jgi:uncharacterized protein YwgA
MNAARVELKLVLDAAGIPDIDLGTFSQRFNIQKRVYLVQIMGYDLGYRYGWYIKGPYSRNLTADAFTLREELIAGQKDHEGYKLSPEAIDQVSKAQKLWELPKGLGLGSDQWLELLASIHYLKHIVYWPKGANKDFDAVFKMLIEAKPHFANAKSAATQAWARLDSIGLIANKTLA